MELGEGGEPEGCMARPKAPVVSITAGWRACLVRVAWSWYSVSIFESRLWCSAAPWRGRMEAKPLTRWACTGEMMDNSMCM